MYMQKPISSDFISLMKPMHFPFCTFNTCLISIRRRATLIYRSFYNVKLSLFADRLIFKPLKHQSQKKSFVMRSAEMN